MTAISDETGREVLKDLQALCRHADKYTAEHFARKVSEKVEAALSAAPVGEPWTTDLSLMPKDREFLVKMSDGRYHVAHFIGAEKKSMIVGGAFGFDRTEKIVAWRDIDTTPPAPAASVDDNVTVNADGGAYQVSAKRVLNMVVSALLSEGHKTLAQELMSVALLTHPNRTEDKGERS